MKNSKNSTLFPPASHSTATVQWENEAKGELAKLLILFNLVPNQDDVRNEFINNGDTIRH